MIMNENIPSQSQIFCFLSHVELASIFYISVELNASLGKKVPGELVDIVPQCSSFVQANCNR